MRSINRLTKNTHYGLTLPFTCSFHDALCLQRPCLPTIGFAMTSAAICINERETPKTCLTNHKGSMLHHIMPLVINSLRDGHTNTHAHKHTHIAGKSNFKKLVHILKE